MNTLTYTAREYDAESGLYHYRARAYDPTMGRFLQKDPLQGELMSPQTQHPYSYVTNNPVNLTDPTGEIAAVSYAILLWPLSGIQWKPPNWWCPFKCKFWKHFNLHFCRVKRAKEYHDCANQVFVFRDCYRKADLRYRYCVRRVDDSFERCMKRCESEER